MRTCVGTQLYGYKRNRDCTQRAQVLARTRIPTCVSTQKRAHTCVHATRAHTDQYPYLHTCKDVPCKDVRAHKRTHAHCARAHTHQTTIHRHINTHKHTTSDAVANVVAAAASGLNSTVKLPSSSLRPPPLSGWGASARRLSWAQVMAWNGENQGAKAARQALALAHELSSYSVRRVCHRHRRGEWPHVRDPGRGWSRCQVLGPKLQRPAGHREHWSAEQPVGSSRCGDKHTTHNTTYARIFTFTHKNTARWWQDQAYPLNVIFPQTNQNPKLRLKQKKCWKLSPSIYKYN